MIQRKKWHFIRLRMKTMNIGPLINANGRLAVPREQKCVASADSAEEIKDIIAVRQWSFIIIILVSLFWLVAPQVTLACIAGGTTAEGDCEEVLCCPGFKCEYRNASRAGGVDTWENYSCVRDASAPSSGVSAGEEKPSGPVEFTPQITIPGTFSVGGKNFEVKAGQGIVVTGDTFAYYLGLFYKFFIAMLAVVSVVMVMWGGFKRIMAAGSPERIKDANDAIISAISGLVLALISYTLLNLINPALVSFKTLDITSVPRQTLDLVEEEVKNPPDYPALVRIPESNPTIYLDLDAAKYPFLREDTAQALIVASQVARRQGLKIEVNYASRTYAEQLKLYEENCKNGKCLVSTCKPKPDKANCPHTTGQAVDVVCKGKSSSDSCQDELTNIMKQVGFCQLIGNPNPEKREKWHFEYPGSNPVSQFCIK